MVRSHVGFVQSYGHRSSSSSPPPLCDSDTIRHMHARSCSTSTSKFQLVLRGPSPPLVTNVRLPATTVSVQQKAPRSDLHSARIPTDMGVLSWTRLGESYRVRDARMLWLTRIRKCPYQAPQLNANLTPSRIDSGRRSLDFCRRTHASCVRTRPRLAPH